MGRQIENFEKYAEYTLRKNWKGICELNKVDFDKFGTKKELKVLPNYLEKDEAVLALTSGIMKQTQTSNSFDWGSNTWLAVLTNERFLFLDHALLTKSVDTQSVRLENVQAVSASQGWVMGKIQVDLGARVIIIDNAKKSTVGIFTELANKLIRNQKLNEKERSFRSNNTNNGYVQEQLDNQAEIIKLLQEISEKLD